MVRTAVVFVRGPSGRLGLEAQGKEEAPPGQRKTPGQMEPLSGQPADPGQPGGKGQSQQDCFTMMLPFLLVLVVMWFLLIRPQQKQEKLRKAMLGALKKGDRVVTSGGIHGEVAGIHEEEKTVTLKFGSDAGQRIKLDRSAISRIKGAEKG